MAKICGGSRKQEAGERPTHQLGKSLEAAKSARGSGCLPGGDESSFDFFVQMP